MQELNRKNFFKESAKYAAGISAGLVGIDVLGQQKVRAQATFSWPYPYETLDPDAVRILGHDSFWSGKGCSYGSFHGIVEALRDVVGEPYKNFPTEIMIYGHGGTVGWGTLCGALNGAAALISLVCEKEASDQIIHELVGWYTQTNFPTDKSNEYGVQQKYNVNKYTETLPQNTSDSPLCHVSVTEWCHTAHHNAGDLERKERCARLTGDVSAKAVELLNDYFNEQFTPKYTPPESISECSSCHSSTAMALKMECRACHANAHTQAAVQKPEPIPSDYNLDQNYPNPFNPTTTIAFSLPKNEKVTISIYDLNGHHVKTLVDNELYSAGKHAVQWNRLNAFGEKVSSGMYYYRIKAGNFVRAKNMLMVK